MSDQSDSLTDRTTAALGRISAEHAPELLDRLRRSGIPARLDHRSVVYVADEDLSDARIVRSTMPADAAAPPTGSPLAISDDDEAHIAPAGRDQRTDELLPDNLQPDDLPDADATFASLVADLDLSTPSATDEKQAAGRAENVGEAFEHDDPPELAEAHYEPPAPPPIPRPAAPTVGAILVVIAGLLILIFGHLLGLAQDTTLVLGLLGIVAGAVMLVMRLRPHRDDSDDGAVL